MKLSHSMQERHWDYVLGPPRLDLDADWSGQSVLASVASGQEIIGIPLNLDLDAPFLLRSLAVRCAYPVDNVGCTKTQPLDSLYMRFTGPVGDYFQQDFVPLNLFLSFFGQLGNPRAVFREVQYPAAGAIKVDLLNNGTTTLKNVSIYFRGVKLFPWGRRQAYTYPERMKTNPFNYPLTVSSLGVKQVIRNIQFQNVQDADFVVRSSQGGLNETTGTVFEIFFKFKDENQYPYSNVPVHADVLFGQASNESPNTFNCGGTQIQAFETGPGNPGLWYPEIYIPRQHSLFYDVYRDDSLYGCAATVNYPFTLNGAKVWPL